ncbi:MAG TPA: CDP-alcohol phosphatidyltransferase family protein [Gemmatimonadales bacterium]
MATAARELTFFLAEPERRLLRALAARLPAAVSSDHLTALGVLGALGAGAAYALSRVSPIWLWVASAMLVVQWVGDSLDGTLARVRRAERPRYGYYLDHVVDAFSTAVIGLGIGLSGYVHLGAALGIVVVYLALSINVYLESAVLGVFRLAYNRMGPTEVRIIMVIANALLAVLSPVPSPMARTVATATLGILAAGMTGLLATRFARNLRTLAQLEPCGHTTAVRSPRAEARFPLGLRAESDVPAPTCAIPLLCAGDRRVGHAERSGAPRSGARLGELGDRGDRPNSRTRAPRR